MININLLPEEYRKEKASISELLKRYKSLAVPVILLIIGIIAVISLAIVVYPNWQARSLRCLEIRWKNIEKDYQEVISLREEEKKLKDKLDSINYITASRLIWSVKLNQISDALPGAIQLTEITMASETYKDSPARDVLIISGIVPVVPGDLAIEEFIKNLKDNTGFTKDFPQIELPLTEATAGGGEKFILKCFLSDKYVLERTRKEKPKKRK